MSDAPLSPRRWLLAVAVGVAGLACSYGLARAGEPQSVWLWCVVGRLC
jgi:hypothetical protein